MNVFPFHTKLISSQILSNLTRRLREVKIAPEDALDELVELDPETKLGKAMTEIMVLIAGLQLMDYYQGYEREENTIKIYLSPDAKPDSLKELVKKIEDDIESPNIKGEEKPSIIRATLYKTNASEKDFLWVLKIETYCESTEEEVGEAPVDIDLKGEVELSNEKE